MTTYIFNGTNYSIVERVSCGGGVCKQLFDLYNGEEILAYNVNSVKLVSMLNTLGLNIFDAHQK